MKDECLKGEELLSSINMSSLSRDTVPAENHPTIRYFLSMIHPLKLDVSAQYPQRINVVISIIDFNYFFGGYISVFNFAKRLSLEGYCVRMIIVDKCAYEPFVWREKIKKYGGLEDFFDCAEVVYAYDRSRAVSCNPRDAFVATSWWTAHIAHAALEHIEADRFVYFTQEYEPIFYNHCSHYALVNTSYELPHYGLFSTELLRDYHRSNKIGLFRGDGTRGEEHSIAFSNAILQLTPDASSMSARKVKRILFYARPEDHAARNLFELGMLALSRGIRQGVFDSGAWEFYGIGTLNEHDILLDAGRNIRMRLLPKVSLNVYQELLPQFDLGISLMLSPHPSLVPLEMASAGMIVVTNTCVNKTSERLREISTNFVAAEPTIDGVVQSLETAAKRVFDYQDRIAGSAVNWPHSWEEVFNRTFMDRVKTFLDRSPDPVMQKTLLLEERRRERISYLKWLSTIYAAKARDLILPRNTLRRRIVKKIANTLKFF